MPTVPTDYRALEGSERQLGWVQGGSLQPIRMKY